MSSNITLRLEKGSKLSYPEGDNNFKDILNLFRSGEDAPTAGGTPNDLTLAYVRLPVNSLVSNMFLGFTAGATNTGAVTLTADTTATKSVINPDGSPLMAGDIVVDNYYVVRYDLNLDQYVLFIGTSSGGGGLDIQWDGVPVAAATTLDFGLNYRPTDEGAGLVSLVHNTFHTMHWDHGFGTYYGAADEGKIYFDEINEIDVFNIDSEGAPTFFTNSFARFFNEFGSQTFVEIRANNTTNDAEVLLIAQDTIVGRYQYDDGDGEVDFYSAGFGGLRLTAALGPLTIETQGSSAVWPAANAVGALTNNGTGVLSWVAAGGGGVDVEQDGSPIASASTLDFITNFVATDQGGGTVSIEHNPSSDMVFDSNFGVVFDSYKISGGGPLSIANFGAPASVELLGEGGVSFYLQDNDIPPSSIGLETSSTEVLLGGGYDDIPLNIYVGDNTLITPRVLSAVSDGTNTSISLQHNGSDVLVVGAGTLPLPVGEVNLISDPSGGDALVIRTPSNLTRMHLSVDGLPDVSTSAALSVVHDGVSDNLFRVGTTEVDVCRVQGGFGSGNVINFANGASGAVNLAPFASGQIRIGSSSSGGIQLTSGTANTTISGANVTVSAGSAAQLNLNSVTSFLDANTFVINGAISGQILNSFIGQAVGTGISNITIGEVSGAGGTVNILIGSNNAGTVNLGYFDATPIPQPVLTAGTTSELISALGSTSGLGLVDDSGVPAPPNVTGSRGGNAALADLLTQLASLGLIVDGTVV